MIRVFHFLFSCFANIYSSFNFLPSGNFIPPPFFLKSILFWCYSSILTHLQIFLNVSFNLVPFFFHRICCLFVTTEKRSLWCKLNYPLLSFFLKFATSYLLAVFFLFFLVCFIFILNCATIEWLSLPISAHRLFPTSSRDFLNRRLTVIWSVWFSVTYGLKIPK